MSKGKWTGEPMLKNKVKMLKKCDKLTFEIQQLL